MTAWLEALLALSRSGTPCVVVTVAAVRGHSPRGPGAKMLVTSETISGSIGGGNLEKTALERARGMLEGHERAPTLVTASLTPRERGEWGAQCCGGEVTLLFEPVLPARPQVAIFGAGHVGFALARVLRALPLDLYLVDSRPEMLEEGRLAGLPAGPGAVHARSAPFPDFPEKIIAELEPGAHAVILTHDHAEDMAILETALRRADLGYVGLIGSAVKWARFRAELLETGFSEADLARVTTPIGLPGVPGKSPAAIAIATAAQLLAHLGLSEAQA